MDNCLSPYWLLPHSRPQPHTSAQGRGHPRGGTLGSRHWAEEPPASPLTPLWEHSDLLSAQDEFSRNLCLSTLCRATDRTDRGRHKNRTIHVCVNVRTRRSRRARELCVCTSHPSCGASRHHFEPAPWHPGGGSQHNLDRNGGRLAPVRDGMGTQDQREILFISRCRYCSYNDSTAHNHLPSTLTLKCSQPAVSNRVGGRGWRSERQEIKAAGGSPRREATASPHTSPHVPRSAPALTAPSADHGQTTAPLGSARQNYLPPVSLCRHVHWSRSSTSAGAPARGAARTPHVLVVTDPHVACPCERAPFPRPTAINESKSLE